jgi:hypothetical protein
LVTVDFSMFKATDDEPSLEVVAEATLECIRRTAADEHQNWPRLVLKIIDQDQTSSNAIHAAPNGGR